MDSDRTYNGIFLWEGSWGYFSAKSRRFNGMILGTPLHGTYTCTEERLPIGNFFIDNSYALPEDFLGIFFVDLGEPYTGTFRSSDIQNEGSFHAGIAFPQHMHASWRRLMRKEILRDAFQNLNELIDYERKNKVVVSPPEELVYAWSHACPVDKVKVVILGQDPYAEEGLAHGLAFSISRETHVPERCSLRTIVKAINVDYQQELPGSFREFVLEHGCLNGWARQGVLLLNTRLTLQNYTGECNLSREEHEEVNSLIKKGWEAFTDQVIKLLSDKKFGLVFMLWGDDAKKKIKYIDEKKHHILQGVHPSPRPTCKEFVHCLHFTQCNKLLEKHGKMPIDWTDLNEN